MKVIHKVSATKPAVDVRAGDVVTYSGDSYLIIQQAHSSWMYLLNVATCSFVAEVYAGEKGYVTLDEIASALGGDVSAGWGLVHYPAEDVALELQN